MTPPEPHDAPRITTFVLGDYMTNCFVIRPPADPARPDGRPDTRKCWIADCGQRPAEMLDFIARHDLTPEAIVLTHAHLDHIAGLFEARSRLGPVPIWIHRAEEQWLTDPMLNLSALTGIPVTGPTPDRLLDHDEILTLCGQPWRVIHTPGHSPGGICLHHAPSRQAISGDALFNASIGRTDFPGSDHDTLLRSIRDRLYTLPDDTTIHPGHGPTTTIGAEKRTNPFIRA